MAIPSRVLVLGGQRSGKSQYAEQIITASGLSPVYLATAIAGDHETRERIMIHRERRGANWRTVEEPLDLAGALARESGAGFHVLVECMTHWVTNLMGANRSVDEEGKRLVDALASVTGPVVIVSSEVGLGIVPANALARKFADGLGTLNQRLAETVDRVVLVVAGQPLVLKTEQPNTEVVI